eukprot:scaffold10373_cov118-Isochrysis_galbana.AAC.5
MNLAGKVDHWAFCTILPFRPKPGPLLTRGRCRTTNAGWAGRSEVGALSSSKHSVGTNLVSVIQGLYRASTRARRQKQNPPADALALAAETEADRWREVARYGVTVSSGRMVIVGCFDLHIARHDIPPSAVKLPLCHCGRLVGLSSLSTTHACLKIVARVVLQRSPSPGVRIHAGGGTYLSAAARTDRCGAVAQRARSVDTDYPRKARHLDAEPAVRQHNGGSTTGQPPPFLAPSALLVMCVPSSSANTARPPPTSTPSFAPPPSLPPPPPDARAARHLVPSPASQPSSPLSSAVPGGHRRP